jgi:hypothetical protein
VNARDLSTLGRTDAWLNDLIRVCRKFVPVCNKRPRLAARVTISARHLQDVLRTLIESLKPPPKAA